MITNKDLLSHIEKGNDDKKVELKTTKESVQYIKRILKGQKVSGFVKVQATRMPEKVLYTVTVQGRYYLLEFPKKDLIINDATDSVLKRIQDLLKTEEKYSYQAMTRRDRRDYLKRRTDYFKNKKKKSPAEWRELVRSNVQAGKVKQEEFLGLQIKKNIEFLLDREVEYRHLLSELNHDGQEIEKMVEEWYERGFKDDSFMSEK